MRCHHLIGNAAPLAAILFALLLAGCNGSTGNSKDDPNIQRNDREHSNDPSVLSPPILQHPIYECASAVIVQGFVPDAKIEVFVAGNPVPIASIISDSPSGQAISVSAPFVAGQEVTAVQIFDGITSAPSNTVTVISHLEDYPSGLPKPRIDPTPVHECGRAVGYRDVVPGGWVKLFSEAALGGGGFDPAVLIKEHASSASGNSYFTFATGLDLGARVHVESGLCSDVSPLADSVITQPAPNPLNKPSVDSPVYEGENRVVVRNFENSAVLEVFDASMASAGGQPSPGGTGQAVGINPDAGSSGSYTATQALCTTSPHSDPAPILPCSELPPAKIVHPLPGDTIIELTEFVNGSRILIYGDAEEIGDGGGPLVALTRPVKDGETITVVQELGGCISQWVYVVDVNCEEQTGGDALSCSADWPAFQHGVLRDANQNHPGTLADPYRVKSLPADFNSVPASNRWQFTPPNSPAGFRAGPMIFDGRVYVGNGNGFMYAVDAATGSLDWQFPGVSDPALTSNFTCNSSSFGIASSAAYARINNEVDAVIFGAPDKSIGANQGSGRLFALNAQTGAQIWASPELAVVNGTTPRSTSERHEQIGYSSPLVLGRFVYIGIANHCDNPIQNGQIIAVELATGNIAGSFNFTATGNRGGGVWSSVGAGFGAIYATTGNTRGSDNVTEPSPNHGLSFLRLDLASGAIDWKLQPVPFEEDGDPDWASGTTSIAASCGDLILSTMKDGWTYAVHAAPPLNVFWQFPDTGWPFPVGTPTVHGDTRYHRAGAAWNDIFFTTAGGTDVIAKTNQNDVIGGYNRLHAINICHAPRVRWLLEVPGASPATGTSQTRLSPPSVAGGIVYIGTHQNHLVAIADTSVWPSTSSICEHSGFQNADCTNAGYSLVPRPKILADVVFPGGGGILNEPVLAGGRIFVTTTGGNLFMVQP